jgi:hypothetical protein
MNLLELLVPFIYHPKDICPSLGHISFSMNLFHSEGGCQTFVLIDFLRILS